MSGEVKKEHPILADTLIHKKLPYKEDYIGSATQTDRSFKGMIMNIYI